MQRKFLMLPWIKRNLNILRNDFSVFIISLKELCINDDC